MLGARRHLGIAITFVLVTAGPLAAQHGRITGRAAATESGAALEGARVTIPQVQRPAHEHRRP